MWSSETRPTMATTLRRYGWYQKRPWALNPNVVLTTVRAAAAASGRMCGSSCSTTRLFPLMNALTQSSSSFLSAIICWCSSSRGWCTLLRSTRHSRLLRFQSQKTQQSVSVTPPSCRLGFIFPTWSGATRVLVWLLLVLVYHCIIGRRVCGSSCSTTRLYPLTNALTKSSTSFLMSESSDSFKNSFSSAFSNQYSYASAHMIFTV